MILTYKCNIAKEKRPQWARYLVQVLMNAQRYTYNDTRKDLDHLKGSLDKYMDQLRMSQLLTSQVNTEIVEDGAEAVLFVKRSGKVIFSVYIR